MRVFNENWFQPATIAKLHHDFLSAHPYPFLAIDGLLEESFAATLAAHFPKENMPNFEDYHESFRALKTAGGSAEFLKFLEEATGIEGLILPDDHHGSGVQQHNNGSISDVQANFTVHRVLNMQRGLNMIFFLNSDWNESYGGKLELWDQGIKNCVQAILPAFNRCVILDTSEGSYHGYSKITAPEGVYRNAFFTNFYTPIAEGDKVKHHDPILRSRSAKSELKKSPAEAKENSKNLIKGSQRKLGVRKLF